MSCFNTRQNQRFSINRTCHRHFLAQSIRTGGILIEQVAILRSGDKSLTDFEIEGLSAHLSLADGHAYQDLPLPFRQTVNNLANLWTECEHTSVPEMEQRFRKAFAQLAQSPAMEAVECFKICPTASNTIDIVGSVLAEMGLVTQLVEPTFDNLALILKRRHVTLDVLDEDELIWASENGTLATFLERDERGALFLVQPNNPTGRNLDANSLRVVAEHCARHNTVLVMDNTFRFYNRRPFDDYAILSETGVSFMTIEDTGKVWPTHDLKASLLMCSLDLAPLVTILYNEIFLCHSRFALGILEQYLLTTAAEGLETTIWAQVDEHRALLREALRDTSLAIDERAIDSTISVEWVDCRRTNLSDLELADQLAINGLRILPGRPFFWNSSELPHRQFNIRLALMKPRTTFQDSVNLFRKAAGVDLTSCVTEGGQSCSASY